MEFKATQDTKASIITAVVMLAFFAISYLPSWLSSSTNTIIDPIITLGSPIILLVILAITYYFSVQSYTIDKEGITINRPLSKVLLPKSDIQQLSSIEDSALKMSFRKFGSSGVFGYIGYFYNKNIGNFTMYGTKTSNFILINTLSGKKIILTPDEPEAFISFFEQA